MSAISAMSDPTVFTPRLHILPPPQRRLWNELAAVPAEFVLYGGTALALHLAHRQSVDFDFFADAPIDPSRLQRGIPFMHDARITQVAPNTLSGIVDRSGPVSVSFLGVPGVSPIVPPHRAPDNRLKVASLLDLAATKVSVVQQRAEAKDYLDLDALMTSGSVALPMALSAASAIFKQQFNPQISLKALSYFEDGNLRTLPRAVKDRLAAAAREVDLDRLPPLPANATGSGAGPCGAP